MSAGRVLVVDDEPQIRRVLRATLSAQGYEVQEARTGEDALVAFRDLLRGFVPGLTAMDEASTGSDAMVPAQD